MRRPVALLALLALLTILCVTSAHPAAARGASDLIETDSDTAIGWWLGAV